MKNNDANLSLVIIRAMFKALYLSREEKKAVLPYLGEDVEVTILVIRLHIPIYFGSMKWCLTP